MAEGGGALRAFGEYRLLRKLASGGMADIFLAKQLGPLGFERDVVIKRLKPELYEKGEFLTMFLDEVRLAARLSHPNVVQIHDVGCIGGKYFLCMEYLAGDDLGVILREVNRRDNEVPVMVAAQFIAQAAHGLHYAHELRGSDGKPLNIVHRDVSPANLFVTYAGHVKVLDFGVARAESRLVHTNDGRVKGKTPYLAPELLDGAQADRRSDVYALALTLYVTLTRHQPFMRENPMATMRAVMKAKIPSISDFRDDVPADVVKVVEKGIARDPEQRFQSAGEFAAALETFLSGHTTTTANAAVSSWLRLLLGDKRIEARSHVPSLAVLQASGVKVSGFTESEHPAAQTPPTPAPTPAQEEIEVVSAPQPPPLAPRVAGTSGLRPAARASLRTTGIRQAAPAAPGPSLSTTGTRPAAPAAPGSSLSTTGIRPAAPAAPASAPGRTEPPILLVHRKKRRGRAALKWATAVVTLGLVAGGGVYAYQHYRPQPIQAPVPVAVAAPPVVRPLEHLLAIDCDVPGAKVEVDGYPRGTCPVDVSISVGSHEVVARADGREPAVRQVTVTERDDRLVLLMQLPPPPPPRVRTVVREVAATGRLTLDTIPWTRVYRGGELLGETPLVEAELPRGRQILRVVNPEWGIDRRIIVNIREEELTVKRVELARGEE